MFRPLTLSDRDEIVARVDRTSLKSCFFNFAQIFANHPLYDYRVAMVDGRLLMYNSYRKKMHAPLGDPLAPAALSRLSSHLGDVSFHYVPATYRDEYPEAASFFQATETEGEREYLYSIESLASMEGGQFHRKRNLIARVRRARPGISGRRLSADDADACLELAASWGHRRRRMEVDDSETLKAFNDSIEIELAGMRHCLSHFDELDLDGFGLFLDGRLLAFDIFSGAVGSMIHITYEKYDASVPDCVAVLRQEAARYLLGLGFTEFNFGRDAGFEGLRQSKLSYRPTGSLTTCSLAPLHATKGAHAASGFKEATA